MPNVCVCVCARVLLSKDVSSGLLVSERRRAVERFAEEHV